MNEPFDPAARDQPAPHQGGTAPKKRLERALDWLNHEIQGLTHRKRRVQTRLKRVNHKTAPGVAQQKRGIVETNRIIRANLSYLYGGGHDSSPAKSAKALKADGKGYDCSSGASRQMQVMGVPTPTGTTWTFESDAKAQRHGLAVGAGRYYTLFIKNNSGNDQHVIERWTTDFLTKAEAIAAKGQEWADDWAKNNKPGKIIGWTEVGGNDNPKSRGGMTWFNPTPARIAEFYFHARPVGL